MVSEQNRIGLVLMVALFMVAVGGSALFIGSENEALTLPEFGELTYTIRNNTQIQSVGSYGIEFLIEHGWYHSTFRWWSDDIIYDYEIFPNGFGSGNGRYLDTAALETPWGTKIVYRYFGLTRDGYGPVVSVQYLGVDSGLVYRTDLVRSNYHLEVRLTEVDFSSIWELDRGETYGNDLHIMLDKASRYLQKYEAFILGGGEAGAFLEPPQGQDYRVSFDSTNAYLYCLSESNIMAMVQGHLFNYDQERSLIGDGHLEFVIEDGLTMIFVGGHGDGTTYCLVNIAILEE